MEIWKAVVGYEGFYEVSDHGNVRSLNWRKTGAAKNLWLKSTKRGYKAVKINGKWHSVHRLVAKAFIENPLGLPLINHIDENKTNNCVDNLEWCTQSHNMKAYYCNHPAKSRKRTPKQQSQNNKYKDRNAYKIVQLTNSGEVINVWDYAIDARHAFGYSTTSIWECCEGKRHTAYGYKWRYAIGNKTE